MCNSDAVHRQPAPWSIQGRELEEQEAELKRMAAAVEEAEDGREQAEGALLSLMPLNLTLCDLRRRLASKCEQLASLQVCLPLSSFLAVCALAMFILTLGLRTW
jgi:hypothetical protein